MGEAAAATHIARKVLRSSWKGKGRRMKRNQ
jgi:hypothetical protein